MKSWFKNKLNKLIAKFVTWLYFKLENEKIRQNLLKQEIKKAFEDQIARKRADQYLAQIKEAQDKCNHLKGNKRRGPQVDYAVWQHTMIDGSILIQCMLCRKEWTKKLGNFEEGRRLVEQSTNTPSSSERPMGPAKDRQAPSPVYMKSTDHDADPLSPFASKGWTAYADKLLKKLLRRKKIKENADKRRHSSVSQRVP